MGMNYTGLWGAEKKTLELFTGSCHPRGTAARDSHTCLPGSSMANSQQHDQSMY